MHNALASTRPEKPTDKLHAFRPLLPTNPARQNIHRNQNILHPPKNDRPFCPKTSMFFGKMMDLFGQKHPPFSVKRSIISECALELTPEGSLQAPERSQQTSPESYPIRPSSRTRIRARNILWYGSPREAKPSEASNPSPSETNCKGFANFAEQSLGCACCVD